MRRALAMICMVLLAAACGSSRAPAQPGPPAWEPAGRPAAFGWDGINRRVAMLYQPSAGSHLVLLDFAGNSWVQVSTLNATADQALLIYDSDQKREVVVTKPYQGPSQSFEWDGRSWVEKPPVPGGLTQAADAAYSPDLHATVLIDRGTWLYDAGGWHQVTTPSAPGVFRVVRYDAGHHMVLALDESSYRTWEFDGKDWILLPLEGFTPEYRGGVGRQYPAVALDPLGRWFLFSGDITLSDLWIRDGQYWTRALASSSIPGRVNGVMTWDFARQRMLLFGGYGGTGTFADTWAYDLRTWTHVAGPVFQATPTPATTPASGTRTSPPPAQRDVVGEAHYNAVAADGHGGLLMISSPSQSASFADTWRWDGTSWHQVPTDLAPDANFGGSLVFDPVHKVVVAYGDPGAFGQRHTGQDQTWTWNGTAWSWLHPTHHPPPMYQPSVAFDDAMSAIVLFGTLYDASSSSLVLGDAQTWAWNGNDWTQLFPAAAPPPHYGAAMTFDSALGRLVLIGGRTSTSDAVASPVTWAFDGTTWTQLDVSGPGFYELAAAYDPVSRRIVTLAAPGETYVRDAAGWSHPSVNRFPTGVPVGLVRDTTEGSVFALMAGPGNLLLWRWDGTGWSLVWPSSYSQWRGYQSPAGFALRYPPYWYFFDQYSMWSNYDVGSPLAAGLDAVFLHVRLAPGACSAPPGVSSQSATTVGGVAATRYRWDQNASERVSYLTVRADRSGSCFDIDLMGWSSSAVDVNASTFDQIVASVAFN